MMDSKRYVLLPAYQPTALLPSLARELRLAGFTVVVVDDGSGPDYAVVFEKNSAVMVNQDRLNVFTDSVGAEANRVQTGRDR